MSGRTLVKFVLLAVARSHRVEMNDVSRFLSPVVELDSED